MFNINYSKVMRYVLMLIVGMCFISYGLLTLGQPRTQVQMSDAEIIEAAKDLGLVEPRDLYIQQSAE